MVPVQRKTRTQTRKGRALKSLTSIQTVKDPYSGAVKLAHRACPETGYVAPNGNRPGFFLKVKGLNKD